MPRNAPVKSEPTFSSRAIIGKKGECSRKKEKEENFILIFPSLAAGGFEKAFQTFLWRTFLITNHHHLHPLSCLKTADVFELLTINNNKAPTVQRRVGLDASCWHLVTLLLTKKYRVCTTDTCNVYTPQCSTYQVLHSDNVRTLVLNNNLSLKDLLMINCPPSQNALSFTWI